MDEAIRDYIDLCCKNLESKICAQAKIAALKVEGLVEKEELRWSLSETALSNARVELSKELEHLNKLREQVTGERSVYATKEFVTVKFETCMAAIKTSEEKIAVLIETYESRLRKPEDAIVFSAGKERMLILLLVIIPIIISLVALWKS